MVPLSNVLMKFLLFRINYLVAIRVIIPVFS